MKRPRAILAACAAAAVVVSAVAVARRSQSRAFVDVDGHLLLPEEVDARLGCRLSELITRDAPLRDVIDFLADRTGARIVVRWDVLAAAGADPDTPVDFDLHDVSLAAALDLIVGEFPRPAAAAWIAGRDGIVISSAADLAGEPVVRVYDVRDLVDPVVRPDDVTNGSWFCGTGPPPPKAATLPAPTFSQVKKVQDDRAMEMHYLVKGLAQRPGGLPDPDPQVAAWSGRILLTAPPPFHREYGRALLGLRRLAADSKGSPR